MKCSRFKQVIFLYTDHEMEEELLEAFEQHLSDCPGCARRIDHAQRLLALLRRGCVRTSAPERLRRRILTNLHQRRYRIEKNWS